MVVMLRFAKVIGPLCSEMACRTIFAYVQNDDFVIQDLKMDGTVGTHRSRSREAVEMPGSDVEMVYTEFEECLAAIASMLQPDPRVPPARRKRNPRTERRSPDRRRYKKLDQSIESFLAVHFLPALSTHPKLRGQIELPEPASGGGARAPLRARSARGRKTAAASQARDRRRQARRLHPARRRRQLLRRLHAPRRRDAPHAEGRQDGRGRSD